MSVAETPKTEAAPPNPQQELAIGSVIGAVALLAGLAFVFAALPTLWGMGWDSMWVSSPNVQKNEFLSDALLILVELLVIGGLGYGAYVALQPQKQPGLRAGIVFMAVAIFGSLWFCAWMGGRMDEQFREQPGVGWSVLVVILAASLGAVGYLYFKVPGWMSFLEAVEHQGWFHAYAYKGNQGVRVRRGTIIGVLAVGACAIYTMITNKWFGSTGVEANDWFWLVPYVNAADRVDYIPLMYKVHILMPIVLVVVLVWIAWRIVNVPGFADFLVATEAEMNKVSWTNRSRIMQDTVVVLVTVFLFTSFLFVVDIIWIKVLSAPYIKVLLIDPKQAEKDQQKTATW